MNRELLRVVACYICLHSALAGTRMAAPLLALTLGYDKLAVGVLAALFALPQILLALPAGKWADRRGLKAPICSGVIIATIGGAVAVTWPQYQALCGAAFLFGASLAVSAIAMQRYVGRVANNPEQLKHAFSCLAMAPAFSNFLGPIAAGFAIDHWGFTGAFLLLAALPTAGWVWIRFVNEAPVSTDDQRISGSVLRPWQEPMCRRLLLLNCVNAASFDVHAFVVPVLGHERGLGASVIGMILGSFAIASTAVRAAIPVVAAKMREWMFIKLAMSIAAIAFLAYPFAASPIAMAFCSAAIGVSMGGVQPMIMSLLHQVTPPNGHGTVVATRHMVINATSVATPMLFGAAAGLIGASSLFWLMGVVVGLGSQISSALRGIGDD